MNKQKALVLPFSQIDKEDIPLVGGKGANLGEMAGAGFPIPAGFCVTAEAYRKLISENDLEPKIRILLADLNVENTKKLNEAARKIQNLILRADIPDDIITQVFSLYRHLKPGSKSPLVAVRSSATAEDLPDASFAGQQETYLNIKGEANVIQAVRLAWASLFGARAIYYRATKGFDHFRVALAIPIQLMVQSEVSGVMFSVNPVTNDKQQIVIEAAWGLGDYIVQGVVTPDHYVVKKDGFTIHSRLVSDQTVMEVYKYPSGVKKVKVKPALVNKAKLTDDQIIKLARIGAAIQKHYYFPQDMEWALEDGALYIVQSRPITTLNLHPEKEKTVDPKSLDAMKQILVGAPASPGIAFGPVARILELSHLDEVKEGAVLVTDMTSPDFVPAMKRAAGIITDKGGQTSHAAIVSRELGVPAVVGTKTATKILKNGDQVTLDGASGNIYAGFPKLTMLARKLVAEIPVTATKVYVNLGEPDLAPTVAQGNADGVGLLRAEFMIAQIGIHPKKLIHDHREEVFVNKLTQGLAKFTSSFGDRPVVYRATDFKTNEYRNLIGGAAYEPQEPNPMLGYRGAYRYIFDESVFRLELEAIKNVRNKLGYKNLWLMIPFVRTKEQMAKVKQIVASHGLSRSNSFKLWMMVEIPSNVILLDDFISVGIDGISIGSNDLTMLILGTDRDNETVAPVYNERDPAVMWAFEKIIKTAHKHNITCSICGQAPSVYSDLTEKLVEWGITSISVSPDAIDRTRRIVYEAEKRLLRHG
ncbi:MAG: phosphoenolpyruvate synthase [Patescibacteria group bacterium]